MQTEELIARLARDVPPVSRHALENRLGLGLAMGGAVTLALVLGVWGPRPDLAHAVAGPSFWMKASYTIAGAAVAVAAIRHLARPDAAHGRLLRLIALPVLVLLALAAAELAATPRAAWVTLWLGHSWSWCPWRILVLSVPLQGGLLWAFRRLAPTRLRLAGAAAGLVSGTVAATLYGLACMESSALFVVTWYSLGIALATGLGALLGPRLLRW